MNSETDIFAIGLEGSANKIGIGIIHSSKDGVKILANVRKTYIPEPGHGFLPRDTALHHRNNIISLIKEAIKEANSPKLSCICFTKGPGMVNLINIGKSINSSSNCRQNSFFIMEHPISRSKPLRWPY